MKEKMSITIAGSQYTLRGAEDEEYTRKVAAHLDTKICEILQSAKVSLVEACVLAGMNVTDEYYKVLDTADNLRNQLKEYLEDANRMKAELASLKSELAKQKNHK